MKVTDDIGAKYKFWADSPRVVPLPDFDGVPHFGSRKFDSYEQFNAWKNDLIRQIACRGGLRWKS